MTNPMPDDADLSLPAIVTMVAEFLAELDLHQVTVVCNDWGGEHLITSPGGSERAANLVLVSCENSDNDPPEGPGSTTSICGRSAASRDQINLSVMCCPEYPIRAPNVLSPRVLYGGCSLGIRHKRRWQRDRSESW